jgi:hypothetical protein
LLFWLFIVFVDAAGSDVLDLWSGDTEEKERNWGNRCRFFFSTTTKKDLFLNFIITSLTALKNLSCLRADILQDSEPYPLKILRF